MPNPPHPPLAGLDPAALLKQGAAEDTLLESSTPFHLPPIEELAPFFPQFEILELIGQGGMGAVYKVRQKELDRIVALKILPPAIGETAGFAERFAREAKALARLNHPGIVTIHEFGKTTASAQPLYFILMEFVDGVNLAQLMKADRISPHEALAIVPQICDALQFAHDQGIVHRDIKPENILLDRLGRVKVADFGIAKVVGNVGTAHVTEDVASVHDRPHSTGQEPLFTLGEKIIGTPQYMAPEQINHPADVDHRADIYALGVVFYQMLTGELPGKDLQAPSRKVHIDVRLDEMVLRALDRDPERRYQTAHEFRTVLDDLPQATPPPTYVAAPPKRGMSRRWWWGFLEMIMLGPVRGFNPPAKRKEYFLLLGLAAVAVYGLVVSPRTVWMLGLCWMAGLIFWQKILMPYRAGLLEAGTLGAEGRSAGPTKLLGRFFTLIMVAVMIFLTLFAAIFSPTILRNFEVARKQESPKPHANGNPATAAALAETTQTKTSNGDSSQRMRWPVEKNPPLVPVGEGLEEGPLFPLKAEAVGWAESDGQFNPVMYLVKPIPRGGAEGRVEGRGEREGNRRLFIHRGTDPLATANRFLGSYEINAVPDTDEIYAGFSLSSEGELYLEVWTEVKGVRLTGWQTRPADPFDKPSGGIRKSKSRVEKTANSMTQAEYEKNTVGFANQYLDLVLELAGAEALGFGNPDANRIVTREKLDRFNAAYPDMPDMPDARCLELAAQRLLDLQGRMKVLKDGGLGEKHPNYAKLKVQADALTEVIGDKERVSESGGKKDARTMPEVEIAAKLHFLSNGEITLNGEVITEPALADAMKVLQKDSKDVKVSISSDPGVPYAKVLEIIDLCQKSGIWNLSFAKDEKEKLDTVAEWLGKMDEGNYAECYTASADAVKKAVAEEKWKEAMVLFRTPMGVVVSRKMIKSEEVRELPGMPDGEHRLMQFATEFANKKSAVETVIFTKENDGVWKNSGYFIR